MLPAHMEFLKIDVAVLSTTVESIMQGWQRNYVEQ